MKIRPVVAELLHADRHDEANSSFSQFWERAQKATSHQCKAFWICIDVPTRMEQHDSHWTGFHENWIL
jgi:hypothetical protein